MRGSNGTKGKQMWYTVWNAYTDDVLAIGTADDLAKALGMKKREIYSLISRAKSGVSKKYVVLSELF